MQCELIDFIRRKVTTPCWCNGKAGNFEYDSEACCYRFVGTTQDLNSYLFAERERNDENTPIVINGFLSFLIACWGQDEIAIYNTYNERKKKLFFDIEAKKPGSYKRCLEKEFATQLLKTEKKYKKEFESKFDYIGVDEKNSILEFAQNYLEYTSSIFKQPIQKKQEKIVDFKDLLMRHNKQNLMNLLHELLDYKTGKEVVIVIRALKELGFLSTYKSCKYLHTVVTDEFGDIGGVKNFTNFMKDTGGSVVDKAEIAEVLPMLKRV